ncbi:MAG: hypothetical protein AAFQ82_11405 [Myxococcota bacterium]
MGSLLRERLQTEYDWCAQNLASCERDLKRIPWLGFLGFSVIPGGWYFGIPGIMTALLGTIGLLGFSVYLVNGHRADYRARMDELARKLEQ